MVESEVLGMNLSKRAALFLSTYLLMLLWMTGCSGISANSGKPSAGEATPTPIPAVPAPVKPTYTVQRGEVVRMLTFTGRIVPEKQASLFFRTNGRVQKVYAKTGDQVKTGQVLADLENTDLERELESAQTELASAQRQLEFDRRRAQANLEIAKLSLEEAKSQGRSKYEIGIQELQVELAQIGVDELADGADPHLSNQVADLQAQLKDAQIVSPMDGEVLSISLTEGYAAEAFKSVVVVADPTILEVSADLLDTHLQSLSEGMPTDVLPVNQPGKVVPGVVRQLPYPYGTGADSSTSADVDRSTRIALKSPASEAGLELGDLVRVDVTLEKKPSVLWLPPQAIRVFEGRRFVIVQEGDIQKRVDVKIGIESEDRVEILDGLKEGQVVVQP
ncbi:MAG: efflux RND transporter periplasmic adaptor subunit [Chloroflexi bacterium]|nr:efflux RND transporter periplasmic adaptor subunit [Chloroflexota bacterium]